MAYPEEDLETHLPDLADLPLSQLEGVHHPILAAAVHLLLERLKREQDPLNSFNASI
jgi:FXSXX-COOH protein